MDQQNIIKKKIEKLKLEESQLQSMLNLIQNEINKYEVEQLHLKHELKKQSDEGADDSDSDNEVKVQSIINDVDNIEKINQKQLELNTLLTNKNSAEEVEEESD